MNVSKLAGGHKGAVCTLALVAVLFGGCHSSSPDKGFAEVPGMTPVQPKASPSVQAPMGGSSMETASATTASSQTSPAPVPKPNVPVLSGGTNDSGPLDLLKVQDEVHVTFADLPVPQPPIDDQVKQDGTITLLFNHTFHVAGKTRRDVEKEIHDYYVPDFYRNMTVTVRVTPSTQFYFVDGEVKAPNRQIYIGYITVTRAIASAGGFTDFARKRSVILKRANGQRITVNCLKAIKDPKLDPPVYPGDSIYVYRTWW